MRHRTYDCDTGIGAAKGFYPLGSSRADRKPSQCPDGGSNWFPRTVFGRGGITPQLYCDGRWNLGTHIYTSHETAEHVIWKTIDKPYSGKFKQVKLAGKVMLIMFWDSRSILYAEYLNQGATVTADWYFDTLLRLLNALKWKWHGLLSAGVLLLPHTAEIVRFLLADLKWEVFSHPDYLPDTSPSNYYLFLRLKSDLGGRCFKTVTALQKYVTLYFKNFEHGVLLARRMQIGGSLREVSQSTWRLYRKLIFASVL